MKKLGFIGCGNMGEAMLSGALSGAFASAEDIIVYEASSEKLEQITERYGVTAATNNVEVAKRARLVVLAVKPNVYSKVLAEIRSSLHDDSMLLAISPAYSIAAVRKNIGRSDVKIARCMPNTPALVGCGMTAVCFDDSLNEDDKETVRSFLRSFGKITEINEEQMHAFGSIAGSAPAFVYMVIEAMAQGGTLLGIPANECYRIAAATVEGSARMVLASDKHAAERAQCLFSRWNDDRRCCLLEKAGF